MPLLPNGKVDRRALPAPEVSSGEAYVTPRSPVEEVLAGIWAEVLGLERVGVTEDFFTLGGHSLLATRVVSRVRQAFGVELPLRSLFEAPTVAGLAGRVETLLREEAARQQVPLVPVLRDGSALPLSFAQQRLWFTDRLEPGSAAYNMPFPLRLRGRLNVWALANALSDIVRRHEALRTVFATTDGEPVQVIRPAVPHPLPVVDLRGIAHDRRERELGRLVAEDAARLFDLARGPLLRTTLVVTGEEEHGLLVTMHHMVSDGWSMEVLVHEVSELYAAYVEGHAPALPPLPVQYADYALWQRTRLTGETLDAQVRWWRERLAGAPPLLELPTDRPRSRAQGSRGESVPFALAPETWQALQALARREGVTSFMMLLAAWQFLLSRYSGQEDVVVGTPIAGRNRLETEGLIGFFVNTLALRTSLSGDLTFAELLRRVREGTLGVYQHQEVPFEKLVEELAPERSLSHTPLFQVMFALQDSARGAPGLAGMEVEPLGVGEVAAKFDLSLGLGEAGEALQGALAYRRELWERASMARLLDHYARVLEEVAADPERRLSRISLLREAERAQVLEAWNATAASYPRLPVHRLFRLQAQRTPDAVALSFRDEQITYAELDRRASCLARALRRRGVGPEARVALLADRSPELVVALLGILKAGAAYLPLDPTYPAERLAYLLKDSACAALLVQDALRDLLPAGAVDPYSLEALLAEADGDDDVAEVMVDAENAAYVIYTSGSTGRPKGVLVPHGALSNHMQWMQAAFPLTPDDRVLQKTPFSFDASVWEFWAPLLCGARLVLAEPGAHREPARLARALEEEGITVVQFVPSLFAALLEEDLTRVTTVRRVYCGGEALSAELAARGRAALEAEVVNLYGPTEVCIDATAAVALAEQGGWTVPIGRPVGNVRAYVLDGAGEPVPVGVPGELYLGGAQLARGYLGRPELTGERFVPDAFSGEAGTRLYRTGDRTRWLVSGELEYLGRVDFQVKIRGFRVELGEIEAALREHASVREAVVVAREDAPGERRLVGYVVPDGEGEVSPLGLRAYLKARVPEYMVPSALVVLDAMPLLPNGKVDRRALPAPEVSSGEAYVTPRSPVEEVLAGIWAEVLGAERVGVMDDFFTLGGHSLLATRVASRIREAFSVELPLRALFEAPTVGSLAERVDAAGRKATGLQAPPLVSVPRDGSALPLSFAQQRLWFIDQLQPGSSAYNMPFPLRLRGRLDVRALAGAVSAVVCRHEALRTVFATADREPVQVIRPAGPHPLPVVDLRGIAHDGRERELGRLVVEDAARPFDLARGPLLRTTLVAVGEEEHGLLVSMHHVVSDGWSMGVLVREVSELYAARLEGRAPALAPLPVQYADYALWQRTWLSGETLEAQVRWWRDHLAGAPPLLELPTDRPRPQVHSDRGDSRAIVLPAELAVGLRSLARREGATLFMTLLAVWQALLSRWSGEEDVVVGTPIAGRTRVETEGLLGFFVNTLALRTDLSGDPTFAELLRRVREGTLGAYQHQEVPFERLVEELGVKRSLTHSPLFQVMFSLQNAPAGELRLGGLVAEPIPEGRETARFDLSLGLTETEGTLEGALVYRADLFDPATIDRMLQHLATLLEAVVRDPARGVGEAEVLPAAERARLLAEWNATAAPYASEPCLHHAFAAQAARTPDAPAVVAGAEVLTYAELERRANRVAHALCRRGVGPEVRVGLWADRSAEAVVGVWGVLKAGGAYVPLDPGAPAERLRQVLEDAGIRMVLARAGAPVIPGGVETLALEAEATLGEPESAPESGALPENVAYVIYTSGSTGTPKGVLVEHRNVLNYLRWFDRAVLGDRGFALPMVSRLSFDAHVRQLFPPLLRGEPVWVLPEETVADPGALLEALGTRERTSFGGVPSLWSAMLELVRSGEVARPEGLEAVLLGGEAVSAELAERTFALFPDVALWNHYGPTEATVNTTARRVHPGHRVTLGRPVANVWIYVLDRYGNPVPTGVAGELYVGGAGVTRGYLGRPELTAERFVPDPFSPEAGGRLYRSGDRVRWLPSGEVDYLGRTDWQVKVRGFRIELGEIEAVLERHPRVREAVVVAQEAPGGTRLAAFVVGGDSAPTTEELRAHLMERLPEYMVPSAVVVLGALPLTPNGKVDRKALPAPDLAGDEGAYRGPGTPTEEMLAGIWAEVLGLERVGTTEDFFALGGHSLLATRVVSRIRQGFGVELPLRALFEAPTVAGLAGRVETLLREDAARQAPPLLPSPRDGAPLPLSFAQQRLWFIDRLEPGSAAYHMPFPLRLRGSLDVRALSGALSVVVRRHEALRTVFATVDGEPVQVIRPAGPHPLPVVDLRSLSTGARERELGRLAAEDAARPFDLARGPLLRTTLVAVGEEEHGLLVSMHHVVSDGWSMGVLVREVSELYAARLEGRAPALAPLPVQYADYALWQRARLSGETLDAQVRWWRQRLAAAPPLLALPTDRPRPLLPGDRA
ncbi:MAG TPA: amino acid adenylation domain-containing protein, partial [Longimicrobiaceae bacterium]|nr:amino acid adenylation domain-containing protein [Longimicrobiaceae bacterium]